MAVATHRWCARIGAWLVPFATLAACAHAAPHAAVHARASYDAPSTETPFAIVPRYAAEAAPARMIIVASDADEPIVASDGTPPPNPDPTPQPANAPAADEPPYALTAAPAQVIVQPRVSTYYAPTRRGQIYVDAPDYRARPYYGYRPYPLYSGGPRFGIGWYGDVAPRQGQDGGPRRPHPGQGYGRSQRHGRR